MPYQMSVGIAEERIREDGHDGRRISSEDELLRRLRQLLPGWDVDVATTDRGESAEEVLGSWGRPGLVVRHWPELRYHSTSEGSDATAAISMPEGMNQSDGLYMFLYQDISLMTEMVLLHEAAHAMTVDFNAGHSERWLDTYLDLLDSAGLSKAKNTIAFMTGKMELKFEVVEGARRRQAAFYEPWQGPAKANPMADSFADVRQGFARARTLKDFRLTDEGLARERPTCSVCGSRVEVGEAHAAEYEPKSGDINVMHYTCAWGFTMQDVLDKSPRMGMRKGAPFAGYEDFDDCVSKNRDKDDPEAYCGYIKNKVEGARLRSNPYRSIRR